MPASVTTATESELRSQPEAWERAIDLVPEVCHLLPRAGERVLVVGCGTSWFMAAAYAARREAAGEGPTDALLPTEVPAGRTWDRVIALSRSGTTTEITDLLRAATLPSLLITAVAGGPAAQHADAEIVLDFADEASVVQTRFATTSLMLLRSHLGEDLSGAVADARAALEAEPDHEHIAAEQITFLGSGWTKGLADEAALKLRESSQSWTESYYAMDYRHGPIAIAEPGRLVFVLGTAPAGLAEQVRATGALWSASSIDPVAQLAAVHLLAVRRAEHRHLDPDAPRSLSRAVHLGPEAA